MNKESVVDSKLFWIRFFHLVSIFIVISLLALPLSSLSVAGQTENPNITKLSAHDSSGETLPIKEYGGSSSSQQNLGDQNKVKQTDEYFVFLPLVTNYLPTIIPESTNILTDESNQFLVSISEDRSQFVFSQTTSELNQVDPGDIIVSDDTENAPNGYFHKVLSKQLINGQVILTTGPATLEEAIEQTSVSYSYQISADDIVETSALNGVTLATMEADSPNTEVINLQLNGVMLGGNLVVSGSLNLDLSLNFDLEIGHFSLKRLNMILVATETTSLQLVSTYENSGAEEHEIARYRLARPLTIIVGGFPIVIQPTIVVVLGVDGTVSASLSTALTQIASLSGGVEYVDGDLSPVKDFNNDFVYQAPVFSAQMDIKAYAGVNLELDFYSASPLIPEVELDVRAGPRLQADESLCWVLKGFLEVDLEVELKFIKWELAEINTNLVNVETPIVQATECTLLTIFNQAMLTESSALAVLHSPDYLYDYQVDSELFGEISEVNLATNATASAGANIVQAASTSSLTYEITTNSFGIPSVSGAIMTYDNGWNINPNNTPFSTQGMGIYGNYTTLLNTHLAGDFVFNISSENNSSDLVIYSGVLQFAGVTYEIPKNGSLVITQSVAAYGGYGMNFSLSHIFSGDNSPLLQGTHHITLQWTFYPGGAPLEFDSDIVNTNLSAFRNQISQKETLINFPK